MGGLYTKHPSGFKIGKLTNIGFFRKGFTVPALREPRLRALRAPRGCRAGLRGARREGGPAQGLRVGGGARPAGSAGPGLAPPFFPPLAALRLSPNRQCLRLLSWGQDGSGRWQN